MRPLIPLLVVLLVRNAAADTPSDADPPADPHPDPAGIAVVPAETGTAAGPGNPAPPPAEETTAPDDTAAGPPARPPEEPLDPAAAAPAESARRPPPVPDDLPGDCPAPAARTIEDRLARSDEGDAAADLDLAACWRLLGHPYPESVALARALARGLDPPAEVAARTRLDALGGPPASPATDTTAGARDDANLVRAAGEPPPDDTDDTALAAYGLAGAAGAGLIAGTAFGLAALHESSRAERELAGDTRELEYGVAAAVCLGLGLAAGVAAIVLWPDATTGPAPGPGDVGMGWEVRW